MLCPKCNFTTFDYADTCKKCGYDLKAFKESKGISASKPVSRLAPKPEKKVEAAPIDFESQAASTAAEEAFTMPPEPSSDEGFAAPSPPPPPISEQSISEPAYESLPPYPDAESLPKGGFWIRYVAAFVDGIILLILQSIFGFFIGMGVGMGSVMRGGISEEGQMLSGIIAFFVTIFINMAYSVFFVGWRGQTPGKMALRLKIIRTSGEEMTYGRAFLRWIGYLISAIPLMIGYIMAAFSKQKQALHDKIAGTYVIRL